ncbi:Uncharacterised protein [Vibrio cholerae]|nr:Uncharacterised protein [Vibrio cholerae]
MLVSALVSDPPIGLETLRHGQGRIALSLCFLLIRHAYKPKVEHMDFIRI